MFYPHQTGCDGHMYIRQRTCGPYNHGYVNEKMFHGKRLGSKRNQMLCHAYSQIDNDKEIKAGYMRGSATICTTKVTGVSQGALL